MKLTDEILNEIGKSYFQDFEFEVLKEADELGNIVSAKIKWSTPTNRILVIDNNGKAVSYYTYSPGHSLPALFDYRPMYMILEESK